MRDENSVPLATGSIKANKDYHFDATLLGNFPKAEIYLDLTPKSPSAGTISLAVQKSYRSFLLPEGGPIGFRDGTLLKNQNRYYMISKNELRQFVSEQAALSLGFPLRGFIEVSSEELPYNPVGSGISNTSQYPDSSTFEIDNDYYVLIENKLHKFVSEKAFLSRYSKNQTIKKDLEFLNGFTINNTPIGFSDGSIISYGISVYIISGNKAMPVFDGTTFEAMGYDWNDVIKADGDEVSLYKKTSQFTVNNNHPDGTIFMDENLQYYLIKDGRKYILPSKNIISSWTAKSPIRVSSASEEASSSCFLQKADDKKYLCDLDLNRLIPLAGKDYAFKLNSDKDIKISRIKVTFKKIINSNSFISRLEDLRNKFNK